MPSTENTTHELYEWMAGGYFLLQHVELAQFGERVSGLEVIGNLRPFGEPPSADVRSRFYDDHGNTLDYVYAIDEDTLWISAGERGSPAFRQFRPATIVAASAIRWSFVHGGPSAARGRWRTSSARSASMPAA